MTIDQFIEKNRTDLVTSIQMKCKSLKNKELSDDFLRRWVQNDYELYRWALSSGVEFEA